MGHFTVRIISKQRRALTDLFLDMLNNDGGLNNLGEFYIGATSVEESGPATHSVTIVGGPTSTLATASVGSGVATPTFSGAGRLFVPQHRAILAFAFVSVTAMFW